MKRIRFLLSLIVGAACSGAHAHFIWVSLSSKQVAKVELAEVPGDNAVSFADRAGTLRLWQAKGVPLAAKPEGVAFFGLSASHSIAAELNYGRVEREPGKAFELHYFAKAATSVSDSAVNFGLPVELMASTDQNGDLIVTVWEHGKRAANAEVVAEGDKSTAPIKGVTGIDGTLKLGKWWGGFWAIRARPGAATAPVREYGTLTLGTRDAPKKADPRAFELLKAATLSRSSFPTNLKHVEGEVTVKLDGATRIGKFSYDRGTQAIVESDLAAPVAKEVESQVASMFSHRESDPFEEGEGRYPLTLGDRNEIGQRVFVNDRLESSYRILGKEICEVVRTLGQNRVIVSVLETQPTEKGKSLPKRFGVTVFNAQSGALIKTEYFNDEYQLVKGVWLPKSRQIVTLAGGKSSVITLNFRVTRVGNE